MKHQNITKSSNDPNPIDRVTPLRAYPGWRVRQYRNGMYDATDDYGLSPGFRSFNEAVAHVREEEALQKEHLEQQASEIAAENAWLRVAENAGWDDDPRSW